MLRGVNAKLLLLAAVVLAGGYLFFTLFKTPPPPEASFSPEEVKGFFHKFGCTNCHDIRNTLVGPSFTAIAERYRGEKDAEEKLYKSVREGSQGRWYDPTSTTIYGIRRVMPPQDEKRVPDAELRAMVRWILGLGNE